MVLNLLMFLPLKTANTSSFSPSIPCLYRRCLKKTSHSLRIPGCSLRIHDLAVESPEVNSHSGLDQKNGKRAPFSSEAGTIRNDLDSPEDDVSGGDGEADPISGIQVPRQRYIAVPKSELLDAILLMFESPEEVDQFVLLSVCLDSVLHAEHKIILEDMRRDYNLTHSMEKKAPRNDSSSLSERKVVPNGDISDSATNDTIRTRHREGCGASRTNDSEPMTTDFRLDWGYLLGSSTNAFKSRSPNKSRIDVATHFQHAFVQLLYNAQFEELSVRDLMLTTALNSDSLLTLPIYVDWKKASESNAIIFRRGYATERQKGLLIAEKLDYLQSKLLQAIFFSMAKPLGKVGIWINEALKNANLGHDEQVWTQKFKLWLKELPLLQQMYFHSEQTYDNLLELDRQAESDPPIWLAAQRAVARYEGILSSVGPRGRLLRKLLIWIGVIPSTPIKAFDSDFDTTTSEPYLRPFFLPRITLTDIWEPATRKHCGNDIWKMLKVATSILFSRSVLQEPAFQELILLYTEEISKGEAEDKAQSPLLQLKIYERISIPDLPVIFPHKKLSFRILDTVRLDIASLLGLLAFIINYKFEDILSSPSALLLDVIAISALIIYVTRVALGYKQTWDRYQLLVNRTLYEKTLANGFGSVYFLLDASEQQQYKEAILAYAVLLKSENSQATCQASVKDKCERFMYNMFEEKVEMPIDKAMDTLVRLGLVTENAVDQESRLQAVPCAKAHDILKLRWNGLLHDIG